MNKKNIKDDYILIAVAVLLLILSGGVIFWSPGVKNQNNRSTLRAVPPKIIGSVVLTIDFGNGEKRAFGGDVVENETLLDALILVSKAGDFSYKLDKKINLAAIGKFTATGGKTWQWYINDKKVAKPLNEVILKAGDQILISYE